MRNEQQIREAIQRLTREIADLSTERAKHYADKDYRRYLDALIAESGFKIAALRWVLGDIEEL